MYILYLDESGVPEPHPSQTTHYVFLGMAVHEGTWFALERQVRGVKRRYARRDLRDFELHAAWIRRPYPEQETIAGFEALGAPARYDATQEVRGREIDRLWPGLTGKRFSSSTANRALASR